MGGRTRESIKKKKNDKGKEILSGAQSAKTPKTISHNAIPSGETTLD